MNRIDHIRKSEFNRKNHVITHLSCAVLTEAPNVKKMFRKVITFGVDYLNEV